VLAHALFRARAFDENCRFARADVGDAELAITRSATVRKMDGQRAQHLA
jgi:hypothetical protein